jgi:Flp pilus assembly pilin Flp
MAKKYAKRLRSIGQSTAEYAVLVAIVTMALISMQLYIKRGIQGRLRELAHQLAPGSTPSGAAQYEGNKTSSYTTLQNGTIEEWSDSTTATVYQEDYTERWGGETVDIETN